MTFARDLLVLMRFVAAFAPTDYSGGTIQEQLIFAPDLPVLMRFVAAFASTD